MSDDTAAFLQQREDAGPLAGLLEALRASLDRICQAVRRQAQGLGNENVVLQGAVFSLLQDGNALARLGLHGPDRMLQALAHLARQFIVRPETCTLQAAASLERASDALLEHLGACVHGRQPPDVALFPQYRELQTLRGEARIHPADLWRAPEPWAWRAADLPDRLPESGLAVVPYYYGAALRLRMDAAVLQMIKNSDSAAAYNLRDMALGLAWGESREEARVFWQIAAAYFEALALNYLSADLYAKRTASRVLLQYGALSRAAANKEGEGESEESGATSADIVSEQLAKDLLFFCAQAAPDEGAAPILAAVRAAYDLTLSQGVNYELPRYGRFDPLVLAQTRQRIRAVAETWPKLAAGDASLILEAGEQFGQLGVSLLTLQPEQRELARALLQAMDLTVRKNQPPAEPLATEVAAAILFLEAAYDDLDPTQDIFKLSCSEQLAERIDRAVEIAEGDADTAAELPAAPAWLELLHERVRERREQMAAAAIAAEEAAAEPAPAEAEAMQEEASPPAEAAEADAEPRREPEFAPGQEAMAEAERASESEPEDETEPGRSFASSGFHLELTPDEAFDDADQFKVIGPLQIPIPDYNVFLNETDGWSRQLQTELSEWSLELHRPLPVTCIALTHSLTASAASVGFDELAALARSLALAMLKVRARQQGDAEDARIFTLAADNIRYLLHQFAAGFLKSPEPGLIEELQLISGPDVDTPPAWFEGPQNASLPAESLDDPQDERLAQAQAVRNIAYEGYDDADLFGTEEGESTTERTTELDFRDSEPGETIGGDALDTEGFAGFEALAASALPQLADTLRLWAEQPEDEGARLQALDLLGDLSEAAGQVGAHEWSNQAQQLLLAIEQLGSDGADSGGEWGYAAVSAAQIEPLLLRQADLQQAFDELKMRWAEGGASFDMSVDADAGPESEFDMALNVPPPSRGTGAEAMAQGVSPAMIEKIGQQAGELLQTRGRIEERLDLVHGGLRELDVRLEHLRNVLRQAGVPPETIKELSLVQSHLQEALGEVEEELVAQIQQTMDLQDSLNGLQSDNPHNPDRHGG